MILLRNALLLDPATGDLTEGASVLVDGDRIREASVRPMAVRDALTVDVGGRTLMPGLIDCHVRVRRCLHRGGGLARRRVRRACDRATSSTPARPS